MKNADLPAMPMFSSDAKPCMVRYIDGDKNNSVATSGLTKREHFAALAMQGILSCSKYEAPRAGKLKGMAVDAVHAADALLAELEKAQ